MNLTTDQAGDVSIVRVHETRMMYPMLGDFAAAVAALVGGRTPHVLIDLTPVTYVDSATIGCLMDLYRTVSGAGGQLKLSGVQKRVETMLTMTGAQNFIRIHADETGALASFGA
ncbi:MAG: STAS domain-containing protein [Vicinamibacterales bacterium]